MEKNIQEMWNNYKRWECKLWSAMEEVKILLKNEMELLWGTVEELKAMKEKDVPLWGAQEEARECELWGAMEEVRDSLQNETAAPPGALKEAEVMEEKDVLLQDAQKEAAWIRDGKAGFPDSSFFLKAAITKWTWGRRKTTSSSIGLWQCFVLYGSTRVICHPSP